jgi:hypothetical protein
LHPGGPNPPVVKDNLFDRSTNDFEGTFTADHNAYVSNYVGIFPTNATDIMLTSPIAYQTSWLGNYYQPTNSPLIDKGSTNANLVGLYHYTTQTNQTVEANSMVDIGYHYVAVDSNGKPLDTNGNGIPDYLEDANGNGLIDSGETDWQYPGDLGLKVIITEPKNNSTLP